MSAWEKLQRDQDLVAARELPHFGEYEKLMRSQFGDVEAPAGGGDSATAATPTKGTQKGE
ncbi:MAG: hypothetical protein F9K29_03355 [Hyphomicrobiaceae bacterium]|nr:MAG: hypothetical protein F9K29_03355 [Hyphomicrobiaceae bacterium]